MRHRTRIAAALAFASTLASACVVPDAAVDAAPQLVPARDGGPEGGGQRIVASNGVGADYEGRAYAAIGGTGFRFRAPDGGRDLALMRGFSVTVDGRSIDPADADVDRLHPRGHTRVHAGGSLVEGLALQPGRPVVTLCVSTRTPARLGIRVWPGADGAAFALRSTTPHTRRRDDDGAQHIEAREPATRFLVHLGFGPEGDAALDIAPDTALDTALDAAEASSPPIARAALRTGDAGFDAAFRWAIASNATFRTDEFGPGLWAGLPWFRDNWSRDTFIALPGTHLVTGEFERAQAVIANFARLQSRAAGPEQGRVPNRVAAATDIIYNTVDGTPWLIRAAWETAQASGDASTLPALRVLIRAYVAGAEANLDAEGLLRHAEADTWMDARIRGGRGWSPRGDRAIEIQALWHSALAIGADLALREGDADEAARYAAMAARTREAVLRRFWIDGRLADRLLADGRADFSRRPNAWMAVSVPLLPERFPFLPSEIEAAVTRDTAAALLLPRGPLSLAADDPRFHPKHVDDAHHHKDAAYHNGTVWAWTAGPAISALARFAHQETAYRVTRELARQILEDDAPGHLSELVDATLDAEGRVRPSGTYAQSWSSAEFVRNAVQDYLGLRPRLLDGVIELHPALPAAWTDIDATLPMGNAEPLRFTVVQREGRQRWTFAARSTPLTIVLGGPLAAARRVVVHDAPRVLEMPIPPPPEAWPLAAEPAPPPGGWPVLRGRDVLERFIESGGLDRHPQPTAEQLLAPALLPAQAVTAARGAAAAGR